MIDSITLSTLCQQNIMDNSDKSYIVLNIHDNSEQSCIDTKVISRLQDNYEVRYIHTPENKTLRDIYNDCIGKLQQDDIILLLDDDTDLPSNYITELLYYTTINHDSVLFAPKVIVSGKLYSPYKSYSFISSALKDVKSGEISARNHAFINSGLAIRGRFFIESGFRYPKEVEFYGTDTVFSHAYREYKSTYILMDLIISHDVNNHPDNSNAYNYAGALMKVMKFWLGQLHGFSKIAYLIYMFIYMLKMTIKFRNLIFIKMFMRLK